MNIKRIICFIICFLPLQMAAEDKLGCSNATECFLLVQKTIESNTFYTRSGNGGLSTAVVNFRVDNDFSIFEEKISKSSGNKDLDKAVLESVRRTGSFPQLSGLEKAEAQKFTRISLKISK